MKRYVYMQISKPPLELPEAIADSSVELAQIVGANVNCVQQCISRRNHGAHTGRWIRVEIDDEEENEVSDEDCK